LVFVLDYSAQRTVDLDCTPEFAEYPAAAYTGRIAPPRITGEARVFRTRIREAAADGPNFGGHYRITTWGCGLGCSMGAVVNVKTGHVMMLPATVAEWPVDKRPFEYRADSRLLVMNGIRNESEVEREIDRHFYEISGTKFLYIGSNLEDDGEHTFGELLTVMERKHAATVLAWLAKNPSWRMTNVSDFNPTELKLHLEAVERRHEPNYVVADLNKDSADDLAVLVRGRERTSFGILVFNGPHETGRIRPATFFSARLDRGDMFFLRDGRLLIGPPASDNLFRLVASGRTYKLRALMIDDKGDN
jgi:hypothetical protein